MNLTSFARPRLAVAAANLPTYKFEHTSTELSTRPGQAKPPCGFTTWASGGIQLGWDWVQGDYQVISLYAPTSIFANIILLDADGAPLSPSKTVLELNVLVRGIAWQDVVAERLALSGKRVAQRARPSSSLLAA